MIVIDLLTQHPVELASRAALRAAQRDSSVVPSGVLQYRTPGMLRLLAQAMAGSERELQRLGQAAARHGHEFVRNDCSIAQLVHAYADMSHAVTGFAEQLNIALPADEVRHFQTLLEDAVACAATEYQRQQAASTAKRRAARWRTFECELRQLLHVAVLSFEKARPSSSSALDPSVEARGSAREQYSEAMGGPIRNLLALLDRSPDILALSSAETRPGAAPV